jgi:predicted peroxiredoxin
MSNQLLFTCTHAKDDPERATLPFVIANVAATAGKQAVVVCTVEGVEAHGLPPLRELFEEFLGNGGEVWLCGACTKPRGITEDQVVKGATIIGAAKYVETIANGATPVTVA